MPLPAITIAESVLPASAARVPAAPGRLEYIEVESNVRLHVTDIGQGQPVLLLHGWPLSGDMYEYQFAPLLAAGCRVISLTLRGFGRSDKPYGDYDYDVHADDIKAVLLALAVDNVTLGGYSTGGAIAIRYMSRHAGAHVSKLALFSATAPSCIRRDDFPHSFFSMEDVQGLIDSLARNRPLALTQFAAGYTSPLPVELAAWLADLSMQAMPYASVQTLVAMGEADLRPELASIQVPVAIFHGRHDKINSFALAEQLQLGLPHATLVVFEHSGHALFYEELDKFNAELVQFVTSLA